MRPRLPFPTRVALPLGASLALLTVSLLGAVPTMGYHVGLSTVHTEHVEGPGAFGVSVDLAEPGDLEIVLNAYGNQTSAPASHGAVSYDADGNTQGMIVIGIHDPPDRVTASASLAEGATQQTSVDPWGVSTSVLPGPAGHGAGEVTLTAEQTGHDGDGDEPTQRMFLRYLNREPGTHRTIVWLGAFESTELEVQTDAQVDGIRTQAGKSHVAGDSDLGKGTVNVQAQDSFVGGSVPLEDTSSVGAKTIVDAETRVDAERGLYGIWSLYDRRGACGPQGPCASTAQVEEACREPTGLPCGLGHISWENEHAAGEQSKTYAFWQTSPGPHTFTLDHKTDAYEAGVATAEWSEQLTLLSAADVRLPSSPDT